MTSSDNLTWDPLDEHDLEALAALASACLDADGGLPMIASTGMLRGRYLAGESLAGRDAGGRLVAVAGLVRRDGVATTTGMVHPGRRLQEYGTRLMAWAVERAGPDDLLVSSETLAGGAVEFYARFGLVETFAEVVLRHPLTEVPSVPAPAGVSLTPVAVADPQALFAAYVGSFSDRPGFPDPSAEEWLGELDKDEDYRRDLSMLATDSAGGPAGFVNVLGTWVDQVGVVPAWRGRRLGAHLVTGVLAALAAEGGDEAWLTVNVDNSARGLYEALGFELYGTRARFAARS